MLIVYIIKKWFMLWNANVLHTRGKLEEREKQGKSFSRQLSKYVTVLGGAYQTMNHFF